jgi:hypothetical protein
LLSAQLPPPLVLLLVAAAQGIAHAFALQRYLVTAVAATVLALVQAHQLAPELSPVFEVAERVLDTLIGVSIAWIFSYVLPSWERTQIGALVARTLAAQEKHAQLALALAQPQAGESIRSWPGAWPAAKPTTACRPWCRQCNARCRSRAPCARRCRTWSGCWDTATSCWRSSPPSRPCCCSGATAWTFARLQPPLEQAKQAIAGALKQGAPQPPANAANEEPSPMLACRTCPNRT